MSCSYCGGLASGAPTLAELVDRDFRRARWRQRLTRLIDRLRGDAVPGRPVCFAEGRIEKAVVGRRSLGIQTVELDRIGGSVGRCWDFDRSFMPVCLCQGGRWRWVDRALREGKTLPPVKLYKLGEQYFVEDGNHRVSVSHYLGFQMIEAEVMEFLLAEAASRNFSSRSERG